MSDVSQTLPSALSLPGQQDAERILAALAQPFALGPDRSADSPIGIVPGDSHAQLLRVEARYRTLLEQIPAVTFSAALDGGSNELYVSPQIEALLGFSQKEWLANPVLWYMQLHPDDRERWQAEFARTVAMGADFRAEYRFLARDGREVWVHGEARLARDQDGRALFIQGIAFDITDIKRAEAVLVQARADLEMKVQERTAAFARANQALQAEIGERQRAEEQLHSLASELQTSNAQLTRSNQELDDFAYIASHDLKEPLRGIANYATFLIEDYADKLDDDGRAKLHTLQRLAARLDTLLDSLLEFSRVGRVELAFRETDLNDLVAQVVDSLRITLQQRGIDVRIPQPLPSVQCDRVRMAEVFRNLITNAMKYNDKEQPWIEIGSQSSDEPDGRSLTTCYVRDNGIGIAAKHFEGIFRIFRRLHGRDKFGGGTGAGLTIVKKIVERHGGRVWVESVCQEGTTFYFTIPQPGELHGE
jgi:PAS domain S-box-containing protein